MEYRSAVSSYFLLANYELFCRKPSTPDNMEHNRFEHQSQISTEVHIPLFVKKIKKPNSPKVFPSAARPSSLKTRRFPNRPHGRRGFVGITMFCDSFSESKSDYNSRGGEQSNPQYSNRKHCRNKQVSCSINFFMDFPPQFLVITKSGTCQVLSIRFDHQ